VKRFITYLFTYENGRKGKNVGFIRTDLKGERLELEVHVQGIGRFAGTGKVFLLVKDGTLLGIPLEELAVSQGRGAGRFVYDMQDTGEPGYTVNAVAGAAIRFGNLYYAASSWNEEAPEGLAEGDFEVWEMADPVQQDSRTDVAGPEEVLQERPQGEPRQEELTQESLQGALQPEVWEQNAESELVRLAEEKLKQEQSQPLTAEESRGEPELFSGTAGAETVETETEESGNSGMEYRAPRRIDISDIRKLPKKNWYLCNNSFLIHGFFNYRYLVLVEMEGNGEKKTYLGVPGVYEKPERMMAMLFGFPDFLPEGSQAEPLGQFGYWLCLLDM
jgi:hypothetical protein